MSVASNKAAQIEPRLWANPVRLPLSVSIDAARCLDLLGIAPASLGACSLTGLADIRCASAKSVLRRFMIQVRRFCDDELDDRRIGDELCVAAHHVASLRAAWTAEPITSQPALCNCVLALADKAEAVAIHKQMHYVGSPRPEGIHLSLRAPAGEGGGLLCLATLSEMDLPHLAPLLPQPSTVEKDFLVLSRFFVRDGGRPNLASHFLGRVFDWTRNNMPEVAGLLTYLNPNVGFTGALYAATNWVMIGLEHKRRYLYLDDEYVTDRRIIDDFGMADYGILSQILGGRISRSRGTLAPLKVYAYPLRRALRKQWSGLEWPRSVQPPIDRVGL